MYDTSITLQAKRMLWWIFLVSLLLESLTTKWNGTTTRSDPQPLGVGAIAAIAASDSDRMQRRLLRNGAPRNLQFEAFKPNGNTKLPVTVPSTKEEKDEKPKDKDDEKPKKEKDDEKPKKEKDDEKFMENKEEGESEEEMEAEESEESPDETAKEDSKKEEGYLPGDFTDLGMPRPSPVGLDLDSVDEDEDEAGEASKFNNDKFFDNDKFIGDEEKPHLDRPLETFPGFENINDVEEKPDPCQPMKEFADDVQSLVKTVDLIRKIFCNQTPKNFVQWTYSTAGCHFVEGTNKIFDIVSGPIADQQLDKCLTLEQLKNYAVQAGEAAVMIPAPTNKEYMEQVMNNLINNDNFFQFLGDDTCPERCIDYCNKEILESCLIETCDNCNQSVKSRCGEDKEEMKESCLVLLSLDMTSSSEELQALQASLVERCLDVVNEVEESCVGYLTNNNNNVAECNDLVNYDQAVWDKCIDACDQQQRSEECTVPGDCGACTTDFSLGSSSNEPHYTHCCLGDRFILWLACKPIPNTGHTKWCCSEDLASTLPNEC